MQRYKQFNIGILAKGISLREFNRFNIKHFNGAVLKLSQPKAQSSEMRYPPYPHYSCPDSLAEGYFAALIPNLQSFVLDLAFVFTTRHYRGPWRL